MGSIKKLLTCRKKPHLSPVGHADLVCRSPKRSASREPGSSCRHARLPI